MNNLSSREFSTIVAGGALLAANAGFINVVSMAGIFPGVTVSHVTGTVSRIPIAIINDDFETFALVTSILCSFAFGCFIAGFLVGDSKFTLGSPYGLCLFIESGALFASFLFLRSEFVLGEWCAAFAMGLQNAMVTSYSGLAVRTTHLTGLITDIGNICGQACRKDTKAELWRLKVHIPIFLGFLGGGFFGAISWIEFREFSLLIPVVFTGSVAFSYLSLPYVKEAAVKIQEATSLNNLAELGHDLGIPGIPAPIVKSGPINGANQGYIRKLDDELKNFMADIDADSGAEFVELQSMSKASGSESQYLLAPR